MKLKIIALVFIFGISNAQNKQIQQSVNKLLSSYITVANIPGISVCVSVDNKIVYSNSFGVSDVSNKTPITDSTRYRIGSLTKVLTAAAFVKLIEKGVGAENVSAAFFEESLTGQNNSFVRDFQGFLENAEAAHVSAKVTTRDVEIVTLDHYFCDTPPDFIKIDVEGFEYSVLRGAKVLSQKHHPALMVEVQADRSEIWNFLSDANYVLFNAELETFRDANSLISNVFALHRIRHAGLIAQLGIDVA